MKSPVSRKRLRRAGVTLAAGLLATQPLHAAPSPRHVVLIHGIWDTFRKMQRIEQVLREAGYDPLIVTLTPNGGQRSLEALGEQAHEQIEKHIPHDARFSIVGFSMGGLVARSYMRQFGDPRRIATFISLAAPNHGTWMAWLSGKPGVREMRPGSKFLAAIDADVPRYAGMRWVTIRTPFDLIILPSTSTELPWAKNYSVPVIAHPLLVTDRRVLDLILGTLASEPVSKKSVRAPLASPHGESPQPRSPGTPPRR